MKRKILAGTTGFAVPVFIQDNTSSTGAGLSGLTHSTAGLVAEYRRQGQSTWTAIPLVSKTLGTWVSGGFVADGSRAGYYELDIPNAAIAGGARFCLVRLYGAASMLDVPVELELDAVNYQDAAGFGLSRLDAAITSRPTLAQIEASTVLAKTSDVINNSTPRAF
jgi:hypothetical protein